MEESILNRYVALAKEGTEESVREIMRHLNVGMTIGESKIIDFSLGHVSSGEGVRAMEKGCREALWKALCWFLCVCEPM